MSKFRKKPVVIEAFQWTGDINQQKDPEWINKAIQDGTAWFNDKGTKNCTLEIKTLEGNHTAKHGDYIIQGIQGELYPCKPDIFKKTYEKYDQNKIVSGDVVCLKSDIENHFPMTVETVRGDLCSCIKADHQGITIILNPVMQPQYFKFSTLKKII